MALKPALSLALTSAPASMSFLNVSKLKGRQGSGGSPMLRIVNISSVGVICFFGAGGGQLLGLAAATTLPDSSVRVPGVQAAMKVSVRKSVFGNLIYPPKQSRFIWS